MRCRIKGHEWLMPPLGLPAPAKTASVRCAHCPAIRTADVSRTAGGLLVHMPPEGGLPKVPDTVRDLALLGGLAPIPVVLAAFHPDLALLAAVGYGWVSGFITAHAARRSS